MDCGLQMLDERISDCLQLTPQWRGTGSMYSSIEGTEYPVLGGRCYGDSLILGGRFRDLVNHHGFDGQLARLQFQAESFDRVEDRASWDVGILPGLYLDLVL